MSSISLNAVRRSPEINTPGFKVEDVVAEIQDSRRGIRFNIEMHGVLVVIASLCSFGLIRANVHKAPLCS